VIRILRKHQPLWLDWIPATDQTWYFIAVTPGHEHRVAHYLRQAGATVWWPQYVDYQVQWQDYWPTERLRVRALQPGILWVAGDSDPATFLLEQWPRWQGPQTPRKPLELEGTHAFPMNEPNGAGNAGQRWPGLWGVVRADATATLGTLLQWHQQQWTPYLHPERPEYWPWEAPMTIRKGPLQGQMGFLQTRHQGSLRFRSLDGLLHDVLESDARLASVKPGGRIYCDQGPYAGQFGRIVQDFGHYIGMQPDSSYVTYPVLVKRTDCIMEPLRLNGCRPVQQTPLAHWLDALADLADQCRTQGATPAKIRIMRRLSYHLSPGERKWTYLAPRILHRHWNDLPPYRQTAWQMILPE
jgi:hypothetical protein